MKNVVDDIIIRFLGVLFHIDCFICVENFKIILLLFTTLTKHTRI